MRVLFVIYDSESKINIFPSNIAYVISAVNTEHEVSVYHQDVYHYKDEHLGEHLKKNCYDAICVGVIGGYYQYAKLLSLSKVINESPDRPRYFIIGGHGPSPEPGFFLRKTGADFVVIGEGELTLRELLNSLPPGEKYPSYVKGIAYLDGDNVVVTGERPLIEDIDSIRWPAYERFPIEYYKTRGMAHATPTDSVMFVLASRGCTFHCSFCYRMDKSYRIRDPKDVLEEIRFLQKNWNITYINFLDELLMAGRENITKLCLEIERSGLKFNWYCNGRLNYADMDILRLMKKTGCVYINYGVESVDDKVLKLMKKGLTKEKIERGVENTIKAGISPGINMIFGHPGDSDETLMKAIDFMLRYMDTSEFRTIRPVTPYPGSDLYETAKEWGLLDGPEDFYAKHVNSDLLTVNFTELSDRKFYECLRWANTTLSDEYYVSLGRDTKEKINSLYSSLDVTFRGFR